MGITTTISDSNSLIRVPELDPWTCDPGRARAEYSRPGPLIFRPGPARGPSKFVRPGPFRPADIQARPGPARLFNEMRMTSCLFLLRKRLQPTEFSHNIAGTVALYHINIDDATVKRLRSRPRRFGDGRAINF